MAAKLPNLFRRNWIKSYCYKYFYNSSRRNSAKVLRAMATKMMMMKILQFFAYNSYNILQYQTITKQKYIKNTSNILSLLMFHLAERIVECLTVYDDYDMFLLALWNIFIQCIILLIFICWTIDCRNFWWGCLIRSLNKIYVSWILKIVKEFRTW